MEWYGLVVRKSRGGGRVAAYMRCEGVLWMCGAGIDRGEIPERSVIGHLRAGINHKPKGQQGAKDVGRSRLGSWTAMVRFADDQDSHGAPMHDPDQDTATRAEVAVCQSHAPACASPHPRSQSAPGCTPHKRQLSGSRCAPTARALLRSPQGWNLGTPSHMVEAPLTIT